jgi:hypothetical protein
VRYRTLLTTSPSCLRHDKEKAPASNESRRAHRWQMNLVRITKCDTHRPEFDPPWIGRPYVCYRSHHVASAGGGTGGRRVVDEMKDWSSDETDDPLYADRRNFYKVEKWTRDGTKVDSLLCW